MHLDCEFVTEAVVSTGNEATLGGRGMERAYFDSQGTIGTLNRHSTFSCLRNSCVFL